VQSQGHGLTAITETWWDSSHDWNAVIDGYVLFRKDRPTRRGGGVALYVREKLDSIELCLGVDDEGVESLWVRIKGQSHMGNIVVDVYYGPPDQEEEVDDAFYRQLQAASQSQALVLMGTSTTLMSSGKTTQPGTRSPGGSCRALMITF